MRTLGTPLPADDPRVERRRKALWNSTLEISDLEARLRQGGPEKYRKREHDRGKMLPRERIQHLLDPDSQFLEIGLLVAHDLYDGKQEIVRKGDYFPDMVTGHALQFIEKNRDNPFFLYLAFNLPHYPEQSDPKFDERYKDMKLPRRDYAKTISTVDDKMGQVMQKLDALGLRENTVIIFQSDNGHSIESYQIKHPEHASGLPRGHDYGTQKAGGNTGKWIGNKGTFYEGGIRVPSIVSYPKEFPQGVVRDQPVTAMDWMPTVLKLCGVQRPDLKFDGHDLLPVIKNNAPSPNQVMHWQWGNQWAVRQGDWKLIGNGKRGRSLGNLSGDKPESENFIKTKPQIAKRLLDLHLEWVKEVTPGKRE